MATYANKRVSSDWKTVLTAAHSAGIPFILNSGQRTMAEQRRLYRQNMSGGRPRPGRPLTAYPSPRAPHIRRNHAIDVDTAGDGAKRLAKWLRWQGVLTSFPVPGEPWHIEVNAAGLRRLARYFRGQRKMTYRAKLAAAYAARKRQTRRSRVEFFNRRIQAIKRRLRG